MKHALALISRLTLFRHRREQIDPRFDQRLQRLGTREGLRPVQSGPFRTLPARPEA